MVSADKTWEQTNLQTPILSRVREDEKVKAREENMATPKSVQEGVEEEVVWASELKFFCKLW